ncbi:hypothetical protein CSC67_04775 [Pusillimonas caeni]|uniref:hypothetical protein n=1 Tax=Pusillimonas caeni TaxID=1348472 RepID=UPI000E59DE82|nr:hypothetical protein [Pusillimonas caeni]TFL14674.1 hypothetical protein CSC67_04775 [Pusillimonas caeni]
MSDARIRLLSLDDVRAASPSPSQVLQHIRQAYAHDGNGHVDVPLKIGIRPDRPDSFLDAMPAWVGADCRALGMKWVSYYPDNRGQGKADSSGLIVLNHPEHGHPVCIMEGMLVTFMRTAACAAVMAKPFIRKPPRRLGLVGCGGLGRWALRMFGMAFPTLDTVYVSSLSSASRERFCHEMSREGDWTLIPVAEPSQAVQPADIVISSVPPSSAPPIAPGWLGQDSIFVPLDLLNSWQPEVLSEAGLLVADAPAFFAKLLQAHRPGLAPPRRMLRFQDVSAAEPHHAGPTMIAVCGIASTDVVLGWEIYRRACEAGLGELFDMKASDADMIRAA